MGGVCAKLRSNINERCWIVFGCTFFSFYFLCCCTLFTICLSLPRTHTQMKLLMGISLYWWGSLSTDGDHSLLMGISLYWWGSLSTDGGLSLLMGVSLYWWGRNATEHKAHLRQLFQRLQEHGLVINVAKCQFGRSSIDFLGHRITSHGATPLPSKVEAVRQFKQPVTVKGPL